MSGERSRAAFSIGARSGIQSGDALHVFERGHDVRHSEPERSAANADASSTSGVTESDGGHHPNSGHFVHARAHHRPPAHGDDDQAEAARLAAVARAALHRLDRRRRVGGMVSGESHSLGASRIDVSSHDVPPRRSSRRAIRIRRRHCRLQRRVGRAAERDLRHQSPLAGSAAGGARRCGASCDFEICGARDSASARSP